MSIRNHYVEALHAIAQQYGEAAPRVYIDPDASLQTTVGYTRRHVVEHDKPHYRYDYYRNALSYAMRRLGFDPANRRIVHLDIACGPGVFSWVMHDQMASQNTRNPDQVDYYGYDHSPAMIQLANLFLQHLPVRYRFHGFSNLVEISTELADQDLSNCDVVVSFGYALLQVRDNRTALSDFARLIACVLPAYSCIVVAADARNDAETRAAFASQCDALRNALIDVGVSLEERLVTTVGSIMSARLRKD